MQEKLEKKKKKKKITARMTMLENALILLSSTERGKQATFFSTKLTHSKSDCYSVGVHEAWYNFIPSATLPREETYWIHLMASPPSPAATAATHHQPPPRRRRRLSCFCWCWRPQKKKKERSLFCTFILLGFRSVGAWSIHLDFYSCNKITTTQIQISCQNWKGFFSNISHQIMI